MGSLYLDMGLVLFEHLLWAVALVRIGDQDETTQTLPDSLYRFLINRILDLHTINRATMTVFARLAGFSLFFGYHLAINIEVFIRMLGNKLIRGCFDTGRSGVGFFNLVFNLLSQSLSSFRKPCF